MRNKCPVSDLMTLTLMKLQVDRRVSAAGFNMKIVLTSSNVSLLVFCPDFHAV